MWNWWKIHTKLLVESILLSRSFWSAIITSRLFSRFQISALTIEREWEENTRSGGVAIFWWIFDVISILHEYFLVGLCPKWWFAPIRHTRIVIMDFDIQRWDLIKPHIPLFHSNNLFHHPIVWVCACVASWILRNLCKSNCYFGLYCYC